MTKLSFCHAFDELFNERHLVPILHDYYTHRRVLLVLKLKSVDDSAQVLSIIIPKREADVIKLICKKYSKFKAYRAYSWTPYGYTLSNVNFSYVYSETLVNAFEKIYGGTSFGNDDLYEHVSNAMKVCFRKDIKKSVKSNEYYDVELSDLSVVDDKIICE